MSVVSPLPRSRLPTVHRVGSVVVAAQGAAVRAARLRQREDACLAA